jgi:hypothetical protein
MAEYRGPSTKPKKVIRLPRPFSLRIRIVATAICIKKSMASWARRRTAPTLPRFTNSGDGDTHKDGHRTVSWISSPASASGRGISIPPIQTPGIQALGLTSGKRPLRRTPILNCTRSMQPLSPCAAWESQRYAKPLRGFSPSKTGWRKPVPKPLRGGDLRQRPNPSRTNNSTPIALLS